VKWRGKGRGEGERWRGGDFAPRKTEIIGVATGHQERLTTQATASPATPQSSRPLPSRSDLIHWTVIQTSSQQIRPHPPDSHPDLLLADQTSFTGQSSKPAPCNSDLIHWTVVQTCP